MHLIEIMIVQPHGNVSGIYKLGIHRRYQGWSYKVIQEDFKQWNWRWSPENKIEKKREPSLKLFTVP